MAFINGSESPQPYSERKLAGAGSDDLPWSLEDLVDAQNMEAAGASLEAIASEFGRTVENVKLALWNSGAARSARPLRANVGFAAMKERR